MPTKNSLVEGTVFEKKPALNLGIRFLALLATTGVTIAQTGPSRPWDSQQVKRTDVSQRDRVLLNQALVNNKQHDPVTALVACAGGQVTDVAQQVMGFGATILRRVDEIGYLRVRVPLDKFEKLLHLHAVMDATIDGVSNYEYVLDTDTQGIVWNFDQRGSIPSVYSHLPILPASALKAENPYVPTRDIGAPQFIGVHPSFDGRGTTIAFVEVFPYWSHPVFQTGRKLDGTLVPKFAGILNDGDIGSETDRTLVQMKVEVAAGAGGYFRDTEGKVYRAPGPGEYRFGTFYSATRQSYAVLWSRSQGLVWIDLNQNSNFADDEPLPNANKQFKVAFLPDARFIRTTIPGSPIAVTMDAGTDAIHIYEKASAHTTEVLSLIGGNSFLGGEANGVAPASQLLPVADGGTLHNLIESLLLVAEAPAVDVITLSMSIRSFPNDGESFLALMVGRIVTNYGKPIYAGTDNYGPGLGSSQEFSNSGNVVSVGGYVAPETMSAFTGKQFTDQQPLGLVASSGPSANGALKPDFVTPVLTLFAYPCSGEEDDPHKTEEVKHFPYRFPPCYGAAEGTSFTGPLAAGAAALLISAAKQSHVPYSAERLRWAMRTGARYLPSWPAYRQGSGLLQVESAWQLLNSSIDPPEITAVAPVHHETSRFLKTPGQGPGLYERQGWSAGQRGERIITLTRRTGASTLQRYRVSWLGNDGTFLTQPSMQLPLSKAVSVPIKIQPKNSGVHSAILNLIDPVSGYSIYQTMITIVAADHLTRENEFTSDNQGTVGLESYRPYFVEVPENTSALRVELQVVRGSVRMHYQDPGPLHWSERMTSYPYLVPVMDREVHPAGSWSHMFARPMSGVWEFNLENSDIESADQAEFRLKVTALNVGIELAESTSTFGDSDLLLHARFSNLYGSLLGVVAKGELGTIFSTESSLADSGDPRIFEIHVPPRSLNLMAEIEVPRREKDDIDLYLYDCSSGHCYLWDIAMFGGPKRTILARKPKPGLWKALVCAERPIGRDTSFSYRDVITHSTLGRAADGTKLVGRRIGEQWTETLRPESPSASVASRHRVAWIEVVDERAEEQERKHSLFEEDNPKGGPWNKPASVGLRIFSIPQKNASAISTR